MKNRIVTSLFSFCFRLSTVQHPEHTIFIYSSPIRCREIIHIPCMTSRGNSAFENFPGKTIMESGFLPLLNNVHHILLFECFNRLRRINFSILSVVKSLRSIEIFFDENYCFCLFLLSAISFQTDFE